MVNMIFWFAAVPNNSADTIKTIVTRYAARAARPIPAFSLITSQTASRPC